MRLHSYAFAIAILLHVPVGGDADERAETTGQESKRERLRAEALERARSIRVALAGNGSAVPLVEDPVLRFGDPARENEDGSLWYWGASGRPLVFAEIYRSSVNLEVLWVHAMSLTSTQLVSAQTDEGRWAPRNAPLKLQPIADAPPPSARAAARLRQMKALVLEFEAHEFWEPDNTRYALRPLVRPLCRYDEASSGLLDGAVFVFAHGTNPEILMLVEAHSKDGEPAKWVCGFAPMGSAELHVTRNNQNVWTKPRAPGVVGRPTEPYWLFAASNQDVPPSGEEEGRH